MKKVLAKSIFGALGAVGILFAVVLVSSQHVSADTTSTVSGTANFNSGSVDIWAPFGSETNWTLLNQPFDTGDLTSKTVVSVPGAGGVTTHFDLSGCGDDLLDCFSHPDNYFSVSVSSADIGAGAKMKTSGHVGFYGYANGLSGSASVNYPVSTTMSYPTEESFFPGDNVSLGGSWNMGSGATIAANETKGDVQLDGDFGLHGYLDLCGYGPSESCSSVIPSYGWETGRTTLFSVAAADPVPTIPTGLVGIGGTLRHLSVTPASVARSGNSVTVSGNNQFSDVAFDLDQIAKSLVVPSSAKVPALEGSVDTTSAGIPFSASYNIFDSDAHVTMTADQNLSFGSANVRVRDTFSQPMAGFSGPYTAKAPDNSWVEYNLGDTVTVEFPVSQTQPVTVTPSLSLSGTLHNKTDLDTDGFVTLTAGKFTFHVPGFTIVPAVGGFSTGLQYPEPTFDSVCVLGVCTPSIVPTGYTMHDINVPSFGPWNFPELGPVDVGPLWGPNNFDHSRTTNGLADGDIPVSNFNTVTLASFVLNPQNKPVAVAGGPYNVNEGASVMLDASQSSDADGDALTYQWDFDDNGSVDATGVTTVYDAIDGPSTHPVKLTICDIHENCTATTTAINVANVPPTATFNVPSIVGLDHPLILSLTNPADVSAPDVAAGFLYSFDCKDGHGWSAWSPNDSIDCVHSTDGVLPVKGRIKDKDGGITTYSGEVMLDRTPPEAFNQFDPTTKKVLVYGRDDLSGVSSAPYAPVSVVKTSWGNGDPSTAELRTYTITDKAGNSVTLAEKVKTDSTEIKVTVVSFRYSLGTTITPPVNGKDFEWSVNKSGALTSLVQKMTVGSGLFRKETIATYNTTKDETKIDPLWAFARTEPGLVLLRLATDRGSLVIEP